LCAAAVSGERSDLATLREVWAVLGVGDDDVEIAEREWLVTMTGGRVRFRHPLVRAASYAGVDAAERRSVHAALANIGMGEDERAWHLARSTEGPDESVAAEIEASGNRMLPRSRSAAMLAFQRAVELSPAGEDRTRRLLAAARAAVETGASHEAQGMIDELRTVGPGQPLSTEVEWLGALVALRTGPPGDAATALERVAMSFEEIDRDRAAEAWVTASQAWALSGDVVRSSAAASRSAAVGSGRGGRIE
jgi:hypothetical protein